MCKRYKTLKFDTKLKYRRKWLIYGKKFELAKIPECRKQITSISEIRFFLQGRRH